ncbi:MAG: hypothetical protein APF84_18575 [Gracilibacter sp. BRH_c7a]|nr:MAG: hypothetical protein APF84_18575 [Gracilibacter sp. BRH_c7a]
MITNPLLNLTTRGNSEIGYLSFFESCKDIPFLIKRIYFTYDVPNGNRRGMHAHKKLQQVLWCPYGKIEIMLDDGNNKKIYLLDSPNKGLFVEYGLWREMQWLEKGSVLCVAASEYYKEDDYIRDYDEFLEYVQKGWKEKIII